MKRKKNAIFIAGCAFTNKGPEAMVLTVADSLRQRFPDVEVFVRVPSLYSNEARANRLIPINSDLPTSVISRLMSKLRMARIYYKTTFIDLGGYQFGDPWGEEHAWGRLKRIRYCNKFGNLVFHMPQTWGPFSSASMGEAVRSIINTSQMVYARDKTSLAMLQELVEEGNPKVRFAHDVAWNFQGADLAVGRQLIEETGLSLERNSISVCVTPNLRVYERSEGNGEDNKYIKILGEVIRYLCSAHNARVILIGHELRLNNSEIQDDRILCNYLLKSLDNSLPVVHIDRFLPAVQVKSIIGNCDMAISSRYHALIAALSQGVPALAIGWAHKYDELFSEFNISSNLFSLSQTTEEILKGIDATIKQLPKLRELILPKVELMKKSGQHAIDEVLSRIEKTIQD